MITNIKIFISFSILVFYAGCSSKPLSYDIFEPKSTKLEPEYKAAPVTSEAMYRATMRPYVINGMKYHPTTVSVADKFRGVASWYGDKFHGRKTSNSETYDMHDLTAAHKTLPMNTIVKVTNLTNSKSVVVRINDRGPFAKSRIIDLSYEAAREIDMIRNGTAKVELEIMSFDIVANKFAKKHPQSVVLENFSVQIGSFSKNEGANIYKRKYALVDGRYTSYIKKFDYEKRKLYKVMLKGFRGEEEARDFISKGAFKGSFIIRE